MKRKITTAVFLSMAFAPSLLMAQTQEQTAPHQSIQINTVKQEMAIIEEAERTQDPQLIEKADKIKAQLIASEAKTTNKDDISMQDKITIIEQAKITNDVEVMQGAESIKEDLISKDEDERYENDVQDKVAQTINDNNESSHFKSRDESLKFAGLIAFTFGLGMMFCMLILNSPWK